MLTTSEAGSIEIGSRLDRGRLFHTGYGSRAFYWYHYRLTNKKRVSGQPVPTGEKMAITIHRIPSHPIGFPVACPELLVMPG